MVQARGTNHFSTVNRNDRVIVALVAGAHAMVHTYELSIPVLVPIWLDQFDVTPFELSLVVSIGYGLFGLGALPAGVLADRYDARTLIIGCLVGMGGAFLLLSTAPGLAVVAVALVLWGAAASVYHPSGLSLISRGVKQRGSAFAYHGMAGNVGIALGPLATLLLVVTLDWRTAVALLAIPAAIVTVFALTVDVDERAAVDAGPDAPDATDGGNDEEESLAEGVAIVRTLLKSTFVVVFAVVMFSGMYYRGLLTFLPEILEEGTSLGSVTVVSRTYNPGEYVYVGLLMVGVAGQYAAGKLTDRLHPRWGLTIGFGALAVLAAVFQFAVGVGLVAIVATAALLGLFLFFVQPFYQAAVAEYTPPSARGLSYGITYLGVFGVGALGAVVAGALLTYTTADVLFVALAGLALCAAGLAFGFLTPADSGTP
jgi:MFS family permease